jgi:acetylornithine deacetylase/succinyl-diaminopimelate desuccinylase-like protein
MHGNNDVREYLDALAFELLDRLSAWTRIPSVAGVPEPKHTLTRSANWLAGELRDIGFPTPEIWTGQKGQRCSLNGAPPPDPPPYWSTVTMTSAQEENWDQTSPFDPVPRDGRLYDRGRSDAKGKFWPTTGVSGPISTPPAALRPR